MDRAYESGSSESAPLAPETPSIGYPTAGNPGGGTPATKPGPWWYHMVTEEVRNVILAAGLTPDHEDLSQLSAAIQSLIDFGRLPVGSVVYVAESSAPTGYLKANGAAVSRTSYAELFAAIGTTFGVGDGATTFNLPDLRGEFVRGWDDGRGVDSGRALGGAQSWAIQNITGRANSDLVRFNYAATDGAFAAESMVSRARPSSTTTGDTYGINFDASRVVQTANETRPRNVALLACIKY